MKTVRSSSRRAAPAMLVAAGLAAILALTLGAAGRAEARPDLLGLTHAVVHAEQSSGGRAGQRGG